jgi:predicted nucleotidyltransferase
MHSDAIDLPIVIATTANGQLLPAGTPGEMVDQEAPGLLDYDWDAALPADPVGSAAGPELPNALALFEALRGDARPLLSGPVDTVLAEIMRRIVAEWRPVRILLFGSRGRGLAQPWSDIDLLVELETYTTAQHAVLGLYRTIGRTEPVVDVIVSRPEILATHQGQVATVLGQALRDGRVLYQRPAPHGRPAHTLGTGRIAQKGLAQATPGVGSLEEGKPR